jgi:unsaturated rhamnogalacturonyl hydrolase
MGYAREKAPESVRAELLDLAKEQIAHPNGLPVRDWKMALWYEGLYRLSLATGEPELFAELLRFGDMAGWHPGPSEHGARAMAVAQGWLRVFAADPARADRLAPSLERAWSLLSSGDQKLVVGDGFMLLPALARLCAFDETGGIDAALGDQLARSPEVGSHALDFFGLALAIEALPADAASRPAFEKRFADMAVKWRGKQKKKGFWPGSSPPIAGVEFSSLLDSSLVVMGFGVGIREGLLDEGVYAESMRRAHATSSGEDLSSLRAWELGAVICAGVELLRLEDEGAGLTTLTGLFETAEALRASDREPRAWVQYVPRRKDDIAWENDKMAFRVYGPALASSGEDNGIDAWVKRVRYPIVDKWYREDFAGVRSYHDDSGEGYDGYKVGSTRGCGGTALWVDDGMLTPNVYREFEIYWTGPGRAKFKTTYFYPNGVNEERVIELALGSDACAVSSTFEKDGQPFAGRSVAVGLAAQSKNAEIAFDQERGELALEDSLPHDRFISFARWSPEQYPGAMHETNGAGKNAQALVILETDSSGQVSYSFGFRPL